jgi:hypothetical protein
VLTKPLSATDMAPKMRSVGAELVRKRSLDSWTFEAKVGGKAWADLEDDEGE